MHEEKGANHIMSEPKMKQCVVNGLIVVEAVVRNVLWRLSETLVLERDHHFWGGGHVFSLYWSFEKEEGKLSCPLSSLHCLDASNGWWPRRTFQNLLSGTCFIFFPPCIFCLHFFTLYPSRALLSLCLLPVFREEEAERSDKENDNSPRYLFWILKEIFVLAAVSRHVKVWAESGLVKWASPVHVVLSPFDSDVVK